MNRNRKNRKNRKRQVVTSVAAAMAGIMGAVPVLAATEEAQISKEETVYVNADAKGQEKQIIVSDWLKNAGSEKNLEDQTQLRDVENVKGEETFTRKGNTLTWQTQGEDIYYQGTGDKELPVSMKLTYFLDGQEIQPEDLPGKSGHLKLRIEYENKAEREVEIEGKKQQMYSPFVMVTGLILPDDVFSNVIIDNGKVISDGQRQLVLGVAMPGLRESLGMEEGEGDWASDSLTLPESLEIQADVKDFSMGSTFTLGLTDVLEDLDIKNAGDFDALEKALDELEDAALQLVEGSGQLYQGASELESRYGEFQQGVNTLAEGVHSLDAGAVQLSEGIQAYTQGADTLNQGIQSSLGQQGALTGKVREYENGVNTAVKAIEDYVLGTRNLTRGLTSYIEGEKALAEGAAQLDELKENLGQLESAITGLYEAVDGEGGSQEDIKTAAQALAEGTEKFSQGLKQQEELLEKAGAMSDTGMKLINETETLADLAQNQAVEPARSFLEKGNTMLQKLQEILTQADAVKANGQAALEQAETEAVSEVNAQITQRNQQIESIRSQAQSANEQIAGAKASLEASAAQAADEGKEEEAQSLYQAAAELNGAWVDPQSLENLDEVSSPQAVVELSGPDTGEVKQLLGEMQESLLTLETAMAGAEDKLTAMEGQINQITGMKEDLEKSKTALEQLEENAYGLNTGMTALYGGVETLSRNLGALEQKCQSLPQAAAGIDSLLAGFGELGQYNDVLLLGAAQLEENTPDLLNGVESLGQGTEELTAGLGELQRQLSSGASLLAGNSQSLREGAGALTSGIGELSSGASALVLGSSQAAEGICQLEAGAQQLSMGTQEFNQKGIQKLQQQAETALETVLDRAEALTSEDCRYSTYGGRLETMEGNVKFVIETEEIK